MPRLWPQLHSRTRVLLWCNVSELHHECFFNCSCIRHIHPPHPQVQRTILNPLHRCHYRCLRALHLSIIAVGMAKLSGKLSQKSVGISPFFCFGQLSVRHRYSSDLSIGWYIALEVFRPSCGDWFFRKKRPLNLRPFTLLIKHFRCHYGRLLAPMAGILGQERAFLAPMAGILGQECPSLAPMAGILGQECPSLVPKWLFLAKNARHWRQRWTKMLKTGRFRRFVTIFR